MPGSGKDEFVNVARSFGYGVVTMGDVVRQEAMCQGKINNDRGIGEFASSERQVHGAGIWAERCLPLLGKGHMIIDGSRSLAELEMFRESLGEDIKVVAIHTSRGNRFLRLQKRGRADAPQNWEEFVERDKREIGWGIGSLIALADVMIVNEGTLENFRSDVDKLLKGTDR